MSLIFKLKSIQASIANLAITHSRSPDDIRLVAVTKTHPMEKIRKVFEAGQVDFGENKVQEMEQKIQELPYARWHQIGSLQRNKVKYIAEHVYLIHSLDSLKLMGEIEKQGAKHNRVIDCLIQINISGEEQKGGLEPAGAQELIKEIRNCTNVRITGLMGMAALTPDREIISQQFRWLNQLYGDFAYETSPDNTQVRMDWLSMGMTSDYDLAIEAGSNMVRIGSAIFGERGAPDTGEDEDWETGDEENATATATEEAEPEDEAENEDSEDAEDDFNEEE